MSSPAEQFPTDPDDPGAEPGSDPRAHTRRRRVSLRDQAQATLAKKVARAAKAHRKIAIATAKRTRALADLDTWSSDPATAKLLNPDYTIDAATAPARAAAGPELTDVKASRRRIPAWEEQEIARRTVSSEIACALHLADRTARNLIGEAAMFADPMTATLDKMSTGAISYRHAQVLMEQLSFIPLEEMTELEAKLLPDATELTPGKLAVKARRMRERAHPETLTKRATAAVLERGVWWEGRPDGMGTLTWYGTAEQTQAAHDRLTSIAHATRGAQGTEDKDSLDPAAAEEQRRTISQLCSDAMADLLLDGVTPTGTGGGIRGSVMVTVPVFTLMGRTDEPGHLEGYGPIPADTARHLAAHCPSFIRLLTHPETGAILSVGKEHYTPPADLRRAVALRDGTCRFPGCSRPASRSEIDHTTPWSGGGPTDYDNLAHLCAFHHRLKHQTLWQVEQEPGGVLRWTSPGGLTHRTHPDSYLGPPAPPPVMPAPAADTESGPPSSPPQSGASAPPDDLPPF